MHLRHLRRRQRVLRRLRRREEEESFRGTTPTTTLPTQPTPTARGGGNTRSATTSRTPTRLAFTLPAADILAEAGSASFLEDGPPRPDTHPHVDDILDAWTLYNLWEHSGAWEALQNDYRIVLSRSMNGGYNNSSSSGGGAGGDGGGKEIHSPNTESATAVTPQEPRLKERMGRTCGNYPQCTKIHGQPDPTTGQVTRLGIKCRDCHAEFYCSKACRETAKLSHRSSCEKKQRDREERREKKAKKVECHTCKQKFPFTRMKKCSRCRQATYCSVECQRNDWDKHKPVCQASAAAATTTTTTTTTTSEAAAQRQRQRATTTTVASGNDETQHQHAGCTRLVQ